LTLKFVILIYGTSNLDLQQALISRERLVKTALRFVNSSYPEICQRKGKSWVVSRGAYRESLIVRLSPSVFRPLSSCLMQGRHHVSTIYLSPMADFDYIDGRSGIINKIDDSVIALANAILLLRGKLP
jgi:hypothetical protein